MHHKPTRCSKKGARRRARGGHQLRSHPREQVAGKRHCSPRVLTLALTLVPAAKTVPSSSSLGSVWERRYRRQAEQSKWTEWGREWLRVRAIPKQQSTIPARATGKNKNVIILPSRCLFSSRRSTSWSLRQGAHIERNLCLNLGEKHSAAFSFAPSCRVQCTTSKQ